jgi:hypothetical protein
MCGGAVLSDIIPPPRRVAAGHLWPEKKQKRKAGEGRKGRRPRRGVDEEELSEVEGEDFDADFDEFEVDSGESEIESDVVVKQFAAARSGAIRGKGKESARPGFVLYYFGRKMDFWVAGLGIWYDCLRAWSVCGLRGRFGFSGWSGAWIMEKLLDWHHGNFYSDCLVLF